MTPEQRQQFKDLLFDYRRYVATEEQVVRFVENLLRVSAVPAGVLHGDAGQNVEDKRPGHHEIAS